MQQLTRQQIRQNLRTHRSRLPDEASHTAGVAIAGHCSLLPQFKQSQRFAVYLAYNGEVATEPLIQLLWRLDKLCYLPVLSHQRNTLTFAPYFPSTPLTVNRLNIWEPEVSEDEYYSVEQLDVVFLPLVGFDWQGNRLGMGGGFYDATFAELYQAGIEQPLRIGLAYSWQEVEQIPAEPWDVPLHGVLTEKGYHTFNNVHKTGVENNA